MKFTFTEWLTLIKPNTTVRIKIGNAIYSGKRTHGCNFMMELTGYCFT